jgi:hypothetical protein
MNSNAHKVRVVGVDVFVTQEGLPTLGALKSRLELKTISNRGTKVWPGPLPPIHLTDVHGCRFRPKSGSDEVASKEVLELLAELEAAGLSWVHVEKLLEIDGKPGFALAQGE